MTGGPPLANVVGDIGFACDIEVNAVGVAKEFREAGPAALFVLRDRPAILEMGICGLVGRRA